MAVRGCGFFVVITYIVITTIPTNGIEPLRVARVGSGVLL
nr:MAG TPA: hypothetical protein [Caudoviricetes sp.]